MMSEHYLDSGSAWVTDTQPQALGMPLWLTGQAPIWWWCEATRPDPFPSGGRMGDEQGASRDCKMPPRGHYIITLAAWRLVGQTHKQPSSHLLAWPAGAHSHLPLLARLGEWSWDFHSAAETVEARERQRQRQREWWVGIPPAIPHHPSRPLHRACALVRYD